MFSANQIPWTTTLGWLHTTMDHYGSHRGSFFEFDKCYHIQFLIIVEYNKKGFTYVKLTHYVYKHLKKHQNHEWSISNGLYNLGEVECHKL